MTREDSNFGSGANNAFPIGYTGHYLVIYYQILLD